jgi:hypothetical protein
MNNVLAHTLAVKCTATVKSVRLFTKASRTVNPMQSEKPCYGLFSESMMQRLQ